VLASTQQPKKERSFFFVVVVEEKDKEGGWFFIIPIYFSFFFLVPSTFLPSLVVNCRAIVYDPRSLFLLALRSRWGSHLDSRPQLHTRSCQYLTFQRPADRVAHQTLGCTDRSPSSTKYTGVHRAQPRHFLISLVTMCGHRWPKINWDTATGKKRVPST
jgi:hypothetical protein